MITDSLYKGIKDFPSELYAHRSIEDNCEVCGACIGYLCFEYKVLPGQISSRATPVISHIVARKSTAKSGEIPVEHQALSSGALKVL